MEKFIKIQILLDTNIAFIGKNKQDNSNYLVIKNKNGKLYYTLSLKYVDIENGCISKSFNENKKIKIFDNENKKEIWMTTSDFIKNFNAFELLGKGEENE